MDFLSLLSNINSDIENYYQENINIQYPSIKKMMDYALLGGKGVRAALTILTGKMFDARYEDLLVPALAVEMIHAYSLVHDDLPAMDNDSMRRGKDSAHIRFGEANAILAGDALLTHAFSIINFSHLDSEIKVRLSSVLTQASGANGMIAGQIFDMDAEGRGIDLDGLCKIHNHKTGALISSAVKMGAVISKNATTDQINILDEYGLRIGLAFQIYDDLLDVTKSSDVLGKPANSDIENNKSTFPSLLGIEKTKDLALEQTAKAKSLLDRLPMNSDELNNFSDLLMKREF